MPDVALKSAGEGRAAHLAGAGDRRFDGGLSPGPEREAVLNGEPDPVDVHAGRRIRAARRAAGVTQEQLGAYLGLTFQQVQKYERGANRVSVSVLYRIAEKLGVEPGFVFEGLPVHGVTSESPLDDFALSPGAIAVADIFPRLSRSRQAALVAVARALAEEQGSR